MEYGCIGEHLVHSFSKEIHNRISNYDYVLREIAPDALDAFMTERSFKAINVTIPYKQAVIPYLATLSDRAAAIGAVNTIVNKDGKLHGYNTDFSGMKSLLERNGIDPNGKKVLILGTGGTSKTAAAVAQAMGALQTIKVSRSGNDGAVTYADAYALHSDAQIIINTTPCGMYPKCDGIPIEPEKFANLEGMADAIYNPLRTNLVRRAQALDIKASGGLYMLVAQAAAAAELFLNKHFDKEITDSVYRDIKSAKENIVLIGMPACGKSTVARILAERTGRRVIDTDLLIAEREKREIPQIFSQDGEEYFRNAESAVIHDVSAESACIIATGGGAVLRSENIANLKRNGKIFFIDRPLSQLMPTADRPLASSADAIRQRYDERYDIYRSAADIIINAASTSAIVADEIERSLKK